MRENHINIFTFFPGSCGPTQVNTQGTLQDSLFRDVFLKTYINMEL